MNLSKYVVFATILLLSLSSSAAVVTAAWPTPPLGCASNSLPSTCIGVDTHGPRLGAIVFTVVTNDGSLKSDLLTGAIQGAEWTFTGTSYSTIGSTSSTATVKGSTGTYEFDGIGFNTARPYINNVYFRQAMAWETSYTALQLDACTSGGISACTATINLVPCPSSSLIGYPGACYTGTDPYTGSSSAINFNAFTDLSKAGLHPEGNTSDISATCTSAASCPTTAFSAVTNWFVCNTGCPHGASGDQANFNTCTATTSASDCAFNPIFYWRSDDPLRSEVATLLCAAVQTIGFHFKSDCSTTGISGEDAGGDIYGAAISAQTGTGSTPVAYNSHNGYDTGGVLDAAAVNGTATTASTDNWDLYTFGWITSPYYTWTWAFFNPLTYGTGDNFVSYNNPAVTYITNNLYYGTTTSPADTTGATGTGCNAVYPEPPSANSPGTCSTSQAASVLAKLLIAQLPYLNSFYENQLWGVYQSGWTGYANEPSTGPSTGVGGTYNLLNVHTTLSSKGGLGCPTITSCEQGGAYHYALHEAADTGGMNLQYGVAEWVWQVDIWANIYDSPLGVPPTQVLTPDCYMNWMTVGKNPSPCTDVTGPNGWASNEATYTIPSGGHNPTGGATAPTGALGWYYFQPSIPGTYHNVQVITFTFRNNITFSDNVPVTAADFEYSLYALDVTGNSGAYTPFYYEMSGPSGLLACDLISTYKISCVVGTESVWNINDIDVPVVAMHVLDNFVQSGFSNPSGAVDTTQPYSASGATYNAPSSTFCPVGTCRVSATPPKWLLYQPNLEVGSYAFYLFSYAEPPSGSGLLFPVREYPIVSPTPPSYSVIPASSVDPAHCSIEVGYQRAAWSEIADEPCNAHAPSTAFNIVDQVSQFTFDYAGAANTAFSPGTLVSPPGWISTPDGKLGYIGINPGTSSSGIYAGASYSVLPNACVMTVYLFSGGLYTLKSTITMSYLSGSQGLWQAHVPGLAAGTYETVVTCHYTYFGLARTFISFGGFKT